MVICRQRAGSLLKALKSTECRLNVGRPFAAYGVQVGNISAGYDRMPTGQMDLD